MTYEIKVGSPGSIDFAPQSTAAEILQNVRTILATVQFSVPLDRDFGIDAQYLDRPMPIAKAKISNEIMTALKKFEPRVRITSIDFTGDDQGNLSPKVQVQII